MTRRKRPRVASGAEHGAGSGIAVRTLALGVAILLASAAAMAEKADRTQPVRLEADKVTIDDASAADLIFSMLMGDKVEPRREFIEKHAREMANLDV